MTGLLFTFPLSSSWLQGQVKTDQNTLNSNVELLNRETQPLTLIGDEKCGKTLLLFQAAVSYASQDIPVSFISRHPLNRMPLSVHGMTRPSSAVQMKLLTFMYMNTAAELINYCSSVHTRSLLPEVLIVDDLDFYLGQLTEHGPEAGAAKLLALLLDAVDFIKMKSESKSCVTLMGCRGHQKFLPNILRQFKYNMARITVDSASDRKYRLDLMTRSVNATFTYTIHDTGVYLQAVEFKS